MTMIPIATICHGRDDSRDADHRRLTLLIDTTTGRVYSRESEDAEPEYVEVDGIDQVATSYEGAGWDLEWLIDPRDVDARGRPLDLPYVLTELGVECRFATLAEAQDAVRSCYPDADEPTTLTVRGQVQDADGRWLDIIVDETGARVGHVETAR